MGFNQHVRGTWVNEQNLRDPSPPGQAVPARATAPSASRASRAPAARRARSGPSRHRLPADMVVANPKHRAVTEKIWKLPEGTLNPVVGIALHEDHAGPRGRHDQVGLGAGEQSLAERDQRQPLDHRGARDGQLHRRLRRLPEHLGQGRRPDPARRDDLREVGRLRQCRAPHPALAAAGDADRASPCPTPGRPSEFSKRFTLAEVWKEWKIDEKTTLPDVIGKGPRDGLHREGHALRRALCQQGGEDLQVARPGRARAS